MPSLSDYSQRDSRIYHSIQAIRSRGYIWRTRWVDNHRNTRIRRLSVRGDYEPMAYAKKANAIMEVIKMLIDKKIIVATAISLVSGFAIGHYIGKIRTMNEALERLMEGMIQNIRQRQ